MVPLDVRRPQLTVEQSPIPMWCTDPFGRVLTYNAAWYRYTGRDPGSGIGEPSPCPTADGAATAFEALLRGADGIERWFRVRSEPLTDDDGRPAGRIWAATDIDDLRAALAADHSERDEERKRQEIAWRFLADVGGLLSATTDLPGRLARIAQRACPDIASACTIFVSDASGDLRVLALADADPAHAARSTEMQRQYPIRPADPRRTVARTARSLLFERLASAALEATAHDATHLAHLESLGIASLLLVPLVASGRTLGVLQLANAADDRPFDTRDVQLAEALAERIALAIDSTQIYERDRRASLSFQHAALPRTLPTIPGLELRAVYATSEAGAEVGGDWYDAFALPQGMLALSIGDVAGRGVDAAVLMSIVRQAIRVAMLQGLDPARALRAADLALRSEGADRLVTAFVARLDPVERTLTYAMAGHPAPYVRSVDGSVRMLAADPAPPLGVSLGLKPPTKRTRLEPGDLLLLYTDGLIESTRDPVAGERNVMAVLADEALAHAADPAAFVRDAALRDGTTDDVALLTVRVGTERRWSFACGDAMAAQGARSEFVRHLAARAVSDSDIAAAELVFGELVGNVVRYAPGPLDVGLDWRGERPVLHLIDRGPGYRLDARMPADDFAETGRGLFLCATLGENFSVRHHVAGGSHSRIDLPVRAHAAAQRASGE